MEETPWFWHLDQQYDNGIVDATIYSSDKKTQFTVRGIPGQIVDGFVALLTSSYKWGCLEASENSALVEELNELREQKIRDAQAIGGLKGTITKLKSKYGEQ